jgi:tRNA threonylcarbamoyl adenosine modification protein YjeE
MSKRSETVISNYEWEDLSSSGLLPALAWVQVLRPGDRLLFDGEMRSGKSTLIRWILSYYGVQQLAEGSPTFSILHQYDDHPDFGTIVHADLYRLKEWDEVVQTGLEELLWKRNEGLVLIEWPSLFQEEFQSMANVCRQSRGIRLFRIGLQTVSATKRQLSFEPLT